MESIRVQDRGHNIEEGTYSDQELDDSEISVNMFQRHVNHNIK